jgi:hypothetical protein
MGVSMVGEIDAEVGGVVDDTAACCDGEFIVTHPPSPKAIANRMDTAAYLIFTVAPPLVGGTRIQGKRKGVS